MAQPNGLNPSMTEINVAGINIKAGSGAPAYAAAKGSLYMRTDGSSVSTRMYVCQTANTATTGAWTAVTTAA